MPGGGTQTLQWASAADLGCPDEPHYLWGQGLFGAIYFVFREREGGRGRELLETNSRYCLKYYQDLVSYLCSRTLQNDHNLPLSGLKK